MLIYGTLPPLMQRAAFVALGSFLPLAARRMNVSYTSLVLFSLH
jgi:hypothetical protein